MRTPNHQLKLAVGVSGEIAVMGALTVGLKGNKNVTCEMKIVNVSSIFMRQKDKIGLRDLIDRDCCSIAEADAATRGVLTQNMAIFVLNSTCFYLRSDGAIGVVVAAAPVEILLVQRTGFQMCHFSFRIGGLTDRFS